jgi:hypothetical protein
VRLRQEHPAEDEHHRHDDDDDDPAHCRYGIARTPALNVTA